MAYQYESEAWEAGKAMLQEINKNRDEWSVRTWENMGWCVEVRRGSLRVIKHKDTYTSYLGMHGDLGIWHEHFSSIDINKVIEHKLKKAQEVVNELQEMIYKSGGEPKGTLLNQERDDLYFKSPVTDAMIKVTGIFPSPASANAYLVTHKDEGVLYQADNLVFIANIHESRMY